MSASTTTARPVVTITARHIAALQLAETGAALIEHRPDGAVEVLRDLRTAEPCDCCGEQGPIVLRHPARAWADELVESMREAAEERGHVPPIQTLRKLAGIEATAELAAERAREEAPVRPPSRPAAQPVEPATTSVPMPRHRAQPAPATTAAEQAAWRALVAQLVEP